MQLADLMLCVYLLVSLAMTGLVGCTHHDKPKTTLTPFGKLHAKRLDYVNWSSARTDQAGFDLDDRCDSIERSCLRFAAGLPVNYKDAEDPATPGKWYRDSGRTCGPGSGSATSFSRDMALGLAYCAWQGGDTQVARDFLAYVDANGGLTGEGDPAVTALQPALHYLFKAIVAKADSTPLPTRPANPDPDDQTGSGALTASVLTGYQAHLTMLFILLDGLIQGGVTDIEMTVVKDQVKRQPRNALYQTILHKYTDGLQDAAIAILSDESLFPSDRLPTSAQRHASYLWERDDGTDWQPDATTPATTFAGTDLIFVEAVIADSLRGDKTRAD